MLVQVSKPNSKKLRNIKKISLDLIFFHPREFIRVQQISSTNIYLESSPFFLSFLQLCTVQKKCNPYIIPSFVHKSLICWLEWAFWDEEKNYPLTEVAESRFFPKTWRSFFTEEKPKCTKILLPPNLYCLKSLTKYNCLLLIHNFWMYLRLQWAIQSHSANEISKPSDIFQQIAKGHSMFWSSTATKSYRMEKIKLLGRLHAANTQHVTFLPSFINILSHHKWCQNWIESFKTRLCGDNSFHPLRLSKLAVSQPYIWILLER
jgi:hypothetical protein